MRIFLTGHEGYLGAVVAAQLRAAGHEVTGCDAGYFTVHTAQIGWDVRDVTVGDLRGHDVVVHLAGLSNDAAGELSERATEEINQRGSIRLAMVAAAAGVERFVFASSCSVYGAATEQDLGEDAPVRPLTAYARSKLAAERAIVALTALCPTALRFATLFGPSPSFRNDLLVNRMTGSAARSGRITVTGDGLARRPLLHVLDAATAIVHTMAAPEHDVRGAVFNVGVPGANYRVRDVAELVADRFPDARVVFAGSPDRRSYTVRFDRFAERVPSWRPRRALADGVAEVAEFLAATPFEHAERRGERGSWLASLVRRGLLDESFRWRRPLPSAASR